MRVVISRGHLDINKKLARELNSLAKNFNHKHYSKIENIDGILLKRDISVERKKEILLKSLHASLAKAFSVNKGRLNRQTLESLKRRLANIRKIIDKLRSINYYLETAFLQDLRIAGVKIPASSQRLAHKQALARDELEAMEYTAYQLIGKAIVLDKKLLDEYSKKESKVIEKEKRELNNLSPVLAKETELLEHLEAKIPPTAAANANLLKEPMFSHWISRIFALLSYLEHIYLKEKGILRQLKKNKPAKSRIEKKISHLIKEKSGLFRIMEQKAVSMEKTGLSSKFRSELHNFTTVIRV
ncbi:hypothetical protein HYX06_00805 [Candidatus Woesearchaeota archaeon]|nr:hypothetical protein [Candidatus Woesearchaeota archaeon]